MSPQRRSKLYVAVGIHIPVERVGSVPPFTGTSRQWSCALVEPRAESSGFVCVAIADAEAESMTLDFSSPERLTLMHAEGASADERWDGSMEIAGPSRVVIRPMEPLGRTRSLVFRVGEKEMLRAIVHHPANLSGLAHTKRYAILREGLGALGSGECDLARLMVSVEKATEGARATSWMRRHLAISLAVRGMSAEAPRIKPGLARGVLVMAPKSALTRLRVVSAVAGPEVMLRDFEGPRTFLLQ